MGIRIRELVVAFIVCVIIAFSLWYFVLGGSHILKNHYVSVTYPMSNVSDSALSNIKELPTPKKLNFNNCENHMDLRFYASVLNNADEAEALLEQELVLPQVCRENEILMKMDKECNYIELEPKLADINDTWCEVDVVLKLNQSSWPEQTLEEGSTTDELVSYTQEDYVANGQEVSLYYFEENSYAIYYNNDVTYVCKIHSADPEVVKSVIDTI